MITGGKPTQQYSQTSEGAHRMSTLRWKATTLINNIWTSAVLAVLVGVVISVLGDIFIGADSLSKGLKDYSWPILVALYLFFFVTRIPKHK